jgi:hypothetical protein
MLENQTPMRKFVPLLLTFISIMSFAQQNEIPNLENKKKELLRQVNMLNDSIKNIELQINIIKTKEIQNMVTDSTLKVTMKKGAKLKKTANVLGDIITTFSENKDVIILDYHNDYFGVLTDSIFRYVYEGWIKKDEKIYEYIKIKEDEERKLKQLEREQKLKEQKSEWAELEKKYIKKYGEKTYNKLKEGSYWIGMNREMAIISLGRPNDINKTVGSWGVHEQWIYNNLYLYFENGKLSSYQD